MLTKADYQSALDVQSACNLQAVVRSFALLMPRIAEECNGTDAINTHPICRLYAEQINFMAGGWDDTVSYHEAYSICEEKAK